MKIALSTKHATLKPTRNTMDAPGTMNQVPNNHAIGTSESNPNNHAAMDNQMEGFVLFVVLMVGTSQG